MGRLARIAVLVRFARRVLEGAHVAEVTVDAGQGEHTAELASAAGIDSHPLPGDSCVLVPVPGTGRDVCVAVADTGQAGTAEPGAVHVYSRDSAGAPQAILRVQPDGSVWITAPGGVRVEGSLSVEGPVTIDGDVEASGEVTAAEVTAGLIALSTHQHPTAAPGGPSPPIPG